MKTRQKDFHKFKQEVRRWQRRLSLGDWRIDCRLKKMEREVAATTAIDDYSSRVAAVTLNSDATEMHEEDFEAHARHEVLEILLSRLEWLGACRNTTNFELREETHAVIRRLEHLFDNPEKEDA